MSESDGDAHSEAESTDSFDVLAAAKYVRVTTFRRDGTPVGTPLWCAVEDGVLYLSTGEHTGKVKRLRNNARVTVARSNAMGKPKGSTYAGTARLLGGDEGSQAHARVSRRYLSSRPLYFFHRRILRQGDFVGIEVTPPPEEQQ